MSILPEKEPLKFDLNLSGAPEEIIHLVDSIKNVGQQFLYHWKTFPIVLPPTAIATIETENDSTHQSGPESYCTISKCSYSAYRTINCRDLFIPPSFDELDAVAVNNKGDIKHLNSKQLESLRERGLDKDIHGKPKKLNSKQLECIRKLGEFEVPSINFIGQIHKWRLTEWLQKGTERNRESLLDDLALALRFLLVTAKARLSSHFFSVTESLKATLNGIIKLLDIMFGVPSLQAHNLAEKLREERCRYLVAELICRPEQEDALDHLINFIRKQLRRAATEKFEPSKEVICPKTAIPYQFFTPKREEIDLSLFNRDIMKKGLPILMTLLERETRGWFLHFREKLIYEYKAQKLSDEDVEKAVNEAVMKEYLERVYKSIMNNDELKMLGNNIPKLLINQAQCVVLMHRAVENVQRKIIKQKNTLNQRMQYTYPVLSRIGPWIREKQRVAEERFIQECQWSAHEEALTLCKEYKLHQAVYFLQRDLTFMREREPVLVKELKNVKISTRTFYWLTQIWRPNNWIVRRSFQGQSEIIPTVLSSTATAITTPRSNPSQAVFLLERETTRTTSTRWPFWRVISYFFRTWTWTWNAMFFFGIIIPWCSPVSLRSLFCSEAFFPDLELSQINGTLFPRKSSLTSTLFSRLNSLWRHISKSRTHFETKPDTGFIGKGMTRHINRFWNYLIKGIIGTLSMLILFPVICLLCSFGSLIIALLCPLWIPIITLLIHIFNGLIYDLDCPAEWKNRYFVILEALLWNIVIQGFIQPVLACTIAFIFCPIATFILIIGAIVRYWFRIAWDSLIFHLLIKKRGRVPACDSFIVKRIAGPGMATDYFYQIQPEQALAALEAKMELDELNAFQQLMEQKIHQPQKDFAQFVEVCFGPFSAHLAKNGAYRVLEKESQDLMSTLQDKLERRLRELQTGLSANLRSKIRLSSNDLKVTIAIASKMLEFWYPRHVIIKLSICEEEFWESKGLSVNDWSSLAIVFLTDIFSLDFFTPLDDADTKFKLKTDNNVDLSRFTNIIQNTVINDQNSEILGPLYSSRGNIKIQSPYLDVTVFNPRSKVLHHKFKKLDNTSSFTRTILFGGCFKNGFFNSKLYSKNNSIKLNLQNATRLWKKSHKMYMADKLCIPLLIPHPVHIALIIYNRDTENPISLESDNCNSILRALEDHCVDLLFAEYIPASNFDSTESHSSLTSGTIEQEEQIINTYNWQHDDWMLRAEQTGAIRVELASPEDISLDSESTRVVFGSLGTTV
ncbi:uncharacterized protein LOC126903976 isoform X2 [Daktulosphaira vitifoliae]|uniref:uncharacterized protein LOC126903976 isoform X2 n=1 Tax=Daktulosphaira vitifoliae TaxID=58002 RepID=UPI0021AA60A7|nr:uncharacterized protein LOC126903976 isoform X2 [Daktulosphaira vitifoliae]